MWQHKKPIQTCNLDTCTIRYSIGKRFKKIKLATNVLFINSMSWVVGLPNNSSNTVWVLPLPQGNYVAKFGKDPIY